MNPRPEKRDASSHQAAGLVVLAALINGSCIHFLQPQTYYLSTQRADLQFQQYVRRELLAGLPEPLFLRWYTRSDEWRDGNRPYILGHRDEDGLSEYRVGTGGRTITRVYFRDGRLHEVAFWDLIQGGPFSYWAESRRPPRHAVDERMLEGLEGLDPHAEPYLGPPDEGGRWDVPSGSLVENVGPIGVEKGRGPMGTDLFAAARHPSPDAILPPGTRFQVGRWIYSSGRLTGPDGSKYRVHPGLAGLDLCPPGACPLPGEAAVITHDLLVVETDPLVAELFPTPRAPLTGLVTAWGRAPISARRVGVLGAGSRVRILEWSPCASRTARVGVIDDAPGGLVDRVVWIATAPRSLFKPADPDTGVAPSHRAAKF